MRKPIVFGVRLSEDDRRFLRREARDRGLRTAADTLRQLVHEQRLRRERAKRRGAA